MGHTKDADPTWLGDSIGKWDGDTVGHEHSNQLHLVERFQKVDNNNIK
jgi:hypothetical protein